MAAFLLGLPTNGNYTINASSKNDSNYEVVFFQDDWHARQPDGQHRNALGVQQSHGRAVEPASDRLRCDGYERRHRPARAAHARAPLPQRPPSQFNPVGGLIFATPDHQTPTSTTKTAFSPRFGLSWTPAALSGRTVFRTVVGIFDYLYGMIQPQQPGFSYTNTYVATNDSFLSPAATLSNPFPNGLLQPPGASQGVNTYLGQAVTFLNPTVLRQYSVRWTFDIQHQLTKDTTLEVGYIGNHSVHLNTSFNFATPPFSISEPFAGARQCHH